MNTLHVTTVDLTAYCFLRPWFRHLRAQGDRVTLACHLQRFRPELETCTDELINIAIPRSIQPREDLRALAQLVSSMKRVRPELVHTHTSKAGFLGRLAARLAGVPLVVHTIHELPQNAARSARAKWVYRQLERLAARWCDHLVTVSEVNRQQILAERICPPDKLTLVREGLEWDLYANATPRDWKSELGLSADTFLWGMAARLEPAKGHSDLLEAVRLLPPNHHLLLIGTGQLEADLRRSAPANVHFAGWVDDLPAALAGLDAFVLSSHYEGLGIVLLEALALQKPTVSTRVGGTQDILEHERNGLFAEPHNPQDLALQMRRMAAETKAAARWAAAGKEKVQRLFRSEVANRDMERLYDRLRFPASRPSPL